MAQIDHTAPEKIAEAIDHVNATPGLRIAPGYEALQFLFSGPAHGRTLAQLNETYGNLNAHFGWFCRHVAQHVGDTRPDRFALVNRSTNKAGQEVFTLKPTVVAALEWQRGHPVTPQD